MRWFEVERHSFSGTRRAVPIGLNLAVIISGHLSTALGPVVDRACTMAMMKHEQD